MIQRKQTIYLLLAAITAFILTRLSLFEGTALGIDTKRFMVTDHLLLFAVTSLAGLLAIVAIFMFKNRPLQSKLSWFGVLASLVLLGLEVWQIDVFKEKNDLTNSSYSWGALLPIVMFVFFILAILNIRKDEKLVKSLDRFR